MNNAFNPMNTMYNPYTSSYQMAQAQMSQLYNNNLPAQTQSSSITFVNGLEGAKGYMLAPNSTIILMDSDSSKFYIKATDGVGMATIKCYTFQEETVASDKDIYVKKSEINKYIDDYLGLIRGSGNVKSNQEHVE